MEADLLISYLFFAVFCFVSLHLYIRHAHRFGLSDKPNQRSSHDYAVVRGGGFIFGISWLMACAYKGDLLSALNLGLLILMAIGIWDDIKGLSTTIRLFFQFMAVSLLIYNYEYLAVYGLFWTLVLALICTYLVNVFNFMDGINGILGLYSLSIVMLLLFVGFAESGQTFAYGILLISLLSFLFYNLRKKAKVFSGDVGSLSISFLLLGGLLDVLLQEQSDVSGFNFLLILILPMSLFLMDSCTTIIHRLWLRENIFQSHRFHLYQILTPQFITYQPAVSLLYVCIQLLVTFLFWNTADNSILLTFLITLFSIFFLLRLVLLRKTRLITGR